MYVFSIPRKCFRFVIIFSHKLNLRPSLIFEELFRYFGFTKLFSHPVVLYCTLIVLYGRKRLLSGELIQTLYSNLSYSLFHFYLAHYVHQDCNVTEQSDMALMLCMYSAGYFVTKHFCLGFIPMKFPTPYQPTLQLSCIDSH